MTEMWKNCQEKIAAFVERTAVKHNFTIFQVWLGLVLGGLALLGIGRLAGWL